MIILLVAAWIFKSPVEIIDHIRTKEELVESGPILLEAIEPVNNHCRPPEVRKNILGDEICMSTGEKALEVGSRFAEPLIRRFQRPRDTDLPEVDRFGCPKSVSNGWPHRPICKEGFMELHLLVATTNHHGNQ